MVMSTIESDMIVGQIRDLREQMGLTQFEFATRFGLSLSAFKYWETGNRTPDQTALTYLRLILSDPDAVTRLLTEASRRKYSLTAA